MSHRGVGQATVFCLSSKASFNLAEALRPAHRMKLLMESSRLPKHWDPPPSNETPSSSILWTRHGMDPSSLVLLPTVGALCACGRGNVLRWKAEAILGCTGKHWAPVNRGLSCNCWSGCFRLALAFCPSSSMDSCFSTLSSSIQVHLNAFALLSLYARMVRAISLMNSLRGLCDKYN